MKTHKRYLALAATAIICTASLPLGAMKELTQTTSDISCPICLENITNDTTSLNCNEKTSHIFHISCLKKVAKNKCMELKTTFPCPLCRAEHTLEKILCKKEIKKIYFLNNKITQTASMGNSVALTLLMGHEDLVLAENFKIIFENAIKNETNDIIDFFVQNNTTLTNNIIKKSFIDAYFNATHNKKPLFLYKFVCNTKIMNCITIAPTLKKALMAIAKKDYLAFQSIVSKQKIKKDLMGLFIIFAIHVGFDDMIVQFFIKETSSFLKEITPKMYHYAFIQAAIHGNVSIVKEFLKPNYIKKLEKISKKKLGKVLTLVVLKEYLQIIQELLNPENINILNKISNNDIGKALIWAAKGGNINIIQAFLNNKTIMSKLTPKNFTDAFNIAKTEEIKNEINKHIKK